MSPCERAMWWWQARKQEFPRPPQGSQGSLGLAGTTRTPWMLLVRCSFPTMIARALDWALSWC